MIRTKNVFDAADTEDGVRVWVEPYGITLDLQTWCNVRLVMPEVAPPRFLSEWFDKNPIGYDAFRQRYQQHLAHPMFRSLLRKMIFLGHCANITLLHQGMNNRENTATALQEILNEMQIHGTSDDIIPEDVHS